MDRRSLQAPLGSPDYGAGARYSPQHRVSQTTSRILSPDAKRVSQTTSRVLSADAKHYCPSQQRAAHSLPGLLPATTWTRYQDDIDDTDNPVYEFPPPKKPSGVFNKNKVGGFSASVSGDFRRYSTKEKFRVSAYVDMGAPFGLAEMLADEDIAMRIFILDNSGSTCTGDGHILIKDPHNRGNVYHSQAASRWDEISNTAIDQAEWNAKAGVKCEFLLLNSPSPHHAVEGRDYVTIDPEAENVANGVARLKQVLRQNGPRGPTPLTSKLAHLRHRLLQDRLDGRRIMLSIITDGLPSPTGDCCTDRDKQDFMEELRAFATTFNSFIVIRLATDDDTTVNYYNEIDGELELPLDILDDLKGEAIEVYDSGNGWFAYTPMIHRIREGGSMEKLFDLLDERPFTVAEIASFLELLLRVPGDPPFPRDARKLFEHMQQLVPLAAPVYNGRLERMTPPVDIKLLKKALGQTRWARAQKMPGQLLRRASSAVSLRG